MRWVKVTEENNRIRDQQISGQRPCFAVLKRLSALAAAVRGTM